MFIIKSLFGGEVHKGNVIGVKGVSVHNQKMMEDLAKTYVDTLNRKPIEDSKSEFKQNLTVDATTTTTDVVRSTTNGSTRSGSSQTQSRSMIIMNDFDLQKETDGGESDDEFIESRSRFSTYSTHNRNNVSSPLRNHSNNIQTPNSNTTPRTYSDTNSSTNSHSTPIHSNKSQHQPVPHEQIDSKISVLESEMKKLHDQILLERDQRSLILAQEAELQKQKILKKQLKLEQKQLKKRQKTLKKQQKRLSASFSPFPDSPAPPPLPPRNKASPATPRPETRVSKSSSQVAHGQFTPQKSNLQNSNQENSNPNFSTPTSTPKRFSDKKIYELKNDFSPMPSPIGNRGLLKEIQVGVKLTPTKRVSPSSKAGGRNRSVSSPAPVGRGVHKGEENKENEVFVREDIADFLQRALASKFMSVGEVESEEEEKEDESPNTSLAWS